MVILLMMGAGSCSFSPNQLGSTGSGGGIGTISGLSALTIDPQNASLTVTQGGSAQTQQLTVTGTVNGLPQNVTSQVVFSTAPSGVVSIGPTGLATTVGTSGGVVTITASASGRSATATLTVHYSSSGADPGAAGAGVPASPQSLFASSANDTTRAPQLVYPNDGVLFPPNVSGVEIHFTQGAASNTLFEVSFIGAISSIKSYVRCTTPAGVTGCVYLPAPALWQSVALSNAGQSPAQVTVRGTDDSGSSVGSSQTINVRFAQDPVQGGLYYWTTSGKTAIVRWDFGGTTTTAQPYLTPANTDGTTCVGCHALAPDGSKLVASAGGQNDGRLLLWDIKNNVAMQPFPLAQKSQFESWNAAGTQFVGVYGDGNPNHKGAVNLMIFDGTTGAVGQTIDLGGLRGDHPDWTKNTDGSNSIVFTSVDPTASTTDQRPSTGGIDFIQQIGGTWGAPGTLVPSQVGKNRYYPAIAPDGNLVVFDESTCKAGTAAPGAAPDKTCDADTDATATMFLTQLPPGDPTPIPLTAANAPGITDKGNTSLTNSFPKWAPFIEQLDEQHKLMWLTFASIRQYGLRKPPAPESTDETTTGTLIWMVGVQVGVGGADPSFAAFALPFQDITTSNHIAQWTKFFLEGPG